MDTLRTLALCFGVASAQLVSLGADGAVALPTLTQACPPALTITVLPPDYTGLFTIVEGLPTLSVPSLSIDTGISTLLPPALSSLGLTSLSLSLPTVLPSLTLPISIPTAIPTNILPSVTLALPTTSLPVSTLLPTVLPSLTLPISIPTAIPTDLLPSVTLALPTISLPVSALLPTSLLAGPTPTPVAYTCPEYDGQTIFENGLLYVLSCGGQATGDVYTAVTANITNTFNDCFTACDQVGTLLGALFCTGFSFVPDASGSGTCLLQNSVAQDIVFGGSGRIAAVRLLNFIIGGNLVAPVLSALATPPLSIPTGLPTTALPTVPLSSILNGLSSDLSGLSTVIPLPTGLPVSSILNVLSSTLAGITTVNPLPTGLPLSSVPNGLTSDLAGATTALPLPTNLPLSSILNGLSSDLAGLSTTINLPTGLPLSSILNVVSSDLAGLPSLTLSSVLNGLSSNLAGITTIAVSTPSLPAVSIPTVPVVSPTLSLPAVSIPTISVVLPTLSLPTVSISTTPVVLPTSDLPSSIGLTTILTIPTSVPSVSFSSIPSISIPNVSLSPIPSISIPNVSLSPIPSISIPSVSLSPIPSISIPSGVLPLTSTSILGGFSTAVVLPTTTVLPGLPGLSTVLPVLSSAAAASSRSSAASTASTSSAAATSSRSSTTSNAIASITPPTVSITPTATSVPLFRCPQDNGLEYLSPSNQAFRVTCGMVFDGNDISSALQPNLQTCVDSCGGVQGCTGVSYALGICAYKSAVGTGVTSLVDSAAPLDLSCPAGDGNAFMDYLGGNYQVLCNTTFPAATIITSPITKRDLIRRALAPAVAPAVTCSARCTSLSGCIGVFSSTSGVCTFLSAFGTAGTGSSTVDSIVMVGKRYVAVVSGSTVTSTSRATAIPTYTTRTNSAINNAPTTTTTTIAVLPIPSISVGISATLGASVGVGVSGSPSLATPTGFATTASTSVSRVTLVLPVTTILSTSTFTYCQQGNNGFITCPVVSNTLLPTGILPL